MEFLPQIMISGAQVGCIYAMMALSYFIILSATGILNFAQGEWMMLSAVLGVVLLALGLPYPIAILVSVAATVAVCQFFEWSVIRPLQRRNADMTILVVALLGILVVVRYSVGLTFGREDVPIPGAFEPTPIILGSSAFIQPQTLVIYVATALTFGALWLFLQRTWFGRSFRIAAIDPIGAQVVGVNLARIRFSSFAIGAAIAAILGWLYAPLYAAGYGIGAAPGVKGFIALLVGGVGSPWGSLAGGMLLGLFEVATAYYVGSLWSEGIGFALLMVFLIFWPSGLLGGMRGR
ncbi:MAG: branched-chain amino acid ABC transporter permease [Rhizobiales bacterium]|nr:branched-chain amino acid ABC transporter permease [Hyphomicrobiales bacterium]